MVLLFFTLFTETNGFTNLSCCGFYNSECENKNDFYKLLKNIVVIITLILSSLSILGKYDSKLCLQFPNLITFIITNFQRLFSIIINSIKSVFNSILNILNLKSIKNLFEQFPKLATSMCCMILILLTRNIYTTIKCKIEKFENKENIEL